MTPFRVPEGRHRSRLVFCNLCAWTGRGHDHAAATGQGWGHYFRSHGSTR